MKSKPFAIVGITALTLLCYEYFVNNFYFVEDSFFVLSAFLFCWVIVQHLILRKTVHPALSILTNLGLLIMAGYLANVLWIYLWGFGFTGAETPVSWYGYAIVTLLLIGFSITGIFRAVRFFYFARNDQSNRS